MTAAKNSGDEAQYASTKALKEMIAINPETGKVAAGIFMASTLGPEKFAENLSKFENISANRQKLPGEIAKQNADLIQTGLQSGLTRKEITRTMVQTKKLSAETRKTILELETTAKGGPVADPEKRFNMEQKLRKEYNTEVGAFTETQDAFNRVNAAENTAVGDIALITSYMKMIDPGSVVREGEFATAQNAAGAGEKFRNTFNKVMTGERLTAKQRRDFKSQAKSLLTASKKRETEVRAGLSPAIKRYGLDERNVFYTPSEEDAADTGGGASTTTAPSFKFNPATGELEAVGG